MSKSKFSPPEPFFIDPLLHMLPAKGMLTDLESLSSSMFAKYKNLSLMLENVDSSNSMITKMESEQLMLRQVLEWLKLNPDESGLGES
ncbi:MAG: hypothetical protein KDD56_03925 [Bdellovibrionales bacterium]|nr:hypothetical protein [Bdellovibrionales bacterium]